MQAYIYGDSVLNNSGRWYLLQSYLILEFKSQQWDHGHNFGAALLYNFYLTLLLSGFNGIQCTESTELGLFLLVHLKSTRAREKSCLVIVLVHVVPGMNADLRAHGQVVSLGPSGDTSGEVVKPILGKGRQWWAPSKPAIGGV